MGSILGFFVTDCILYDAVNWVVFHDLIDCIKILLLI